MVSSKERRIDVSTDIGKLYGVGSAKKAAYAKLGIYTVDDIIAHYPRGYEDRGNVKLLCDADGQSKSSHILVVATEPRVSAVKGRMSLLKFRAYDESGVCEITFFNQNYLKSVFSLGGEFRFYGKVEKKGSRYYMSSPTYEPILDGIELPPLVSLYHLTEGITQKQITKDIRAAMTLTASADAKELLPEEIRKKYKLCYGSFALKNIHLPDSFASLAAAKRRLIFEELFTFALGISMARSKNEAVRAIPCAEQDISSLISRLPYELTGAQKRVIEDIKKDMARNIAMNRIIVGDVGSGKTVCAAAAMLIAVLSGRQAALMAPTEILARQHYQDISELLSPLGIKCELLVGAMTPAEKRRVHKGLAEADEKKRISVVIGTQALLSDGVEFACPGLVVTDEQHRFGVGQRATLAKKNELSHMLVMSATPIPRTLALTLYGDLDVSVIDEMPRGRQRVDTFVVDESYRARLDGFIEKQVGEGGQVYIVCPAVEDSEEDDDLSLEDIDLEGNIRRSAPLRSAVGFSAELAEKFPQLRVEFLHGKMKSQQKDAVMKSFSEGNVDILVSTTVIEVGVNVPNACLMIVENADRFGLSQLHQLRGRVGRGRRKSYCVLVSEAATEEGTAKDRLNIMRTCYDGYTIAERDLEMRGPGDFLRGGSEASLRQSGGIRFRLASLCDDMGLMKCAFDEARALVSSDPSLDRYPELRETVDRMFTLDTGTIN